MAYWKIHLMLMVLLVCIVIVLWPRHHPRAVPGSAAVASRPVAVDSGCCVYRVSDTNEIQVRITPHGRSVMVQITPVTMSKFVEYRNVHTGDVEKFREIQVEVGPNGRTASAWESPDGNRWDAASFYPNWKLVVVAPRSKQPGKGGGSGK